MGIVRYTWFTVEWYESEILDIKGKTLKWGKRSTGFFAKDWYDAKKIFYKKVNYYQYFFTDRFQRVKFNN